MFEFDAGKLIIIGIVALVVIGPKELPRVMRLAGEALAKMRRMAAEFHRQFLDAMREAEIDDSKAGVDKLADSASPDLGADPFAQLKAELTQALAAAEKPPSLPAADTPALMATQRGSALDTMTSPAAPHSSHTSPAVAHSSDTAGCSRVAESGSLPAPGDAMTSADSAIDKEMQALADALTAEIGETAPQNAGAESATALDGR
jgi:sec-independent protein translocase protein TatB